MSDGNEMLFPIAREKDLVGFKQMGDVQAFLLQFSIRGFLHVPKIQTSENLG